MYNILCANCGRPEIVHGLDVDDILMEAWDTRFYHEEPDIWHTDGKSDEEDALDYLTCKIRGYRHSLETCPGFKYPERKIGYLMERYCAWIFEREGKEVPGDKDLMEYVRDLSSESLLIEKFMKKAKRKLFQLKKDWEKRQPTSLYLPRCVYLVYSPSSGHSTIAVAD